MKRYLYIFPHLQITAGSTIRYHIRKNLKEDEWLLFSYDNLKLTKNPKDLNYKDLLIASEKYINSLSEQRRNKIKVIFGGWVPYGVHKYFPEKTPRYFTFVREPLSRTISLYNHRRQIVEVAKGDASIIKNANEYLLVNGKVPDFETWLMNKYNLKDPSTSIFRKMKVNGFINAKKNISDSILEGLNKFYFIGTLGTFEQDSLYLYNKMGFRSYFLSQNVSKKYFNPGQDEDKLREMIRNKISEDFLLFVKAVEKNKQFKKDHPNFNKIVSKEKLKRILLLPFTQIYYAPMDTVKFIIRKIFPM